MKTVIVTGASRGIGAAICRNLRTKGVNVLGIARSEEPLRLLSLEKIGPGRMEYLVGDVTNPRVAKEAVEKAMQSESSLVGLILNAGTLGPVQPISQMNLDEFSSAFEVNVLSAVAWIKESLPHLRASKGRIVFTSSAAATIPYAGFSAYCSGKSTTNMLLSCLALEEPHIITIALAPGVVDTMILEEFMAKGRPYFLPSQASYLEGLRKEGALLKPEVVAESYSKCVLAAPKHKSGQFCDWNDPWIASLNV